MAWRAGLASALVIGAIAWAPAQASALSCAFSPEPVLFRSADVVFDGVALSGPSEDGRLFAPAHFGLVRFLKGARRARGRHVVSVTAGLSDLLDGLVEEPADEANPVVGEVFRVYGLGFAKRRPNPDVPDFLTSACYGTVRLRARSFLAPVRGGAVANQGWIATSLRADNGIRCLRVLAPRSRSARTACERTARRGPPPVQVLSKGYGPSATTAVAASAPGLRSVEVAGSGAPMTAVAVGPGPVTIAVLPGRLEPWQVPVTLTYRDGRTRRIDGGATAHVDVPDPSGAFAWTATTDVSGPCAGARAVALRFGSPPPAIVGVTACRAARGSPLFFSVGEASCSCGPRGSEVLGPTILVGAARHAVQSIEISGPGGRRELTLAQTGGAFVAIYPAGTSHRDLALTARFRDGSTETFVGRRGVDAEPKPDVIRPR
jgi:hypothetical protein